MDDQVIEIEFRNCDGFMKAEKLYPREALTLLQALGARLDEWAPQVSEDDAD